MKEYSFEKLVAWQEARVLVKMVYAVGQEFPKEESFGLTGQMRRAAISIASNLAEGSGRTTTNDQRNFYRIAYSSTMELLNQLILSCDLDYINDKQLTDMRNQIDKTAFLIHKLRGSLK